MAIGLDGYTATGVLHGAIAGPGRLVDALEGTGALHLESGRLVRLDGASPQDVSGASLPLDDLCVAVAAPDTNIPGHMAWHSLELAAGPWRVRGEMPTMPGFDPGRALARPTGSFVLLRDVHVSLPGQVDAEDFHPYAWVNRYDVEQVEADLELTLFFPGATSVLKASGSV
ncbi:MAG: hypothetical protein ACXVAI_04690 [Candidatus Limnocylindrales bacterium]